MRMPALLARALPHDSAFWRRLAHLGASQGPEWWVRYSPPFFGCAAALALPAARRAVAENLRRVRGARGPITDLLDTAKLFSTYAMCLAEVLSNGSKNGRTPDATIFGASMVEDALAEGRGVIFATAHTAGWELTGPLLARDRHAELVMVMQKERDGEARAVSDDARQQVGVRVVHVGDDPLQSLPLLRHLKGGGVVALQIDRAVPGMRTRQVSLFDAPSAIPEGPLRLAELSGAPIFPIFTARTGYRRYDMKVYPPIRVPRAATEAERDASAQRIADAMTTFVRAHPSQWFRFQSG